MNLRAVGTAMVLVLLGGACGSTVNRPRQQSFSTNDKGLSAQSGGGGGDTGASAAGTSGNGSPSGAAASAAAGGGAGRAATAAGATGVRSPVPGGSSAGPIELGFVRTGVSNAAAFGASLGNTISEADVDNAVVSYFNEHGGIGGRPIVPVYADTDTGSASWDADFAAACAKFTQDHKVAAVLGYVFNHDPAFEACLAQKGVPHLSTTFNVPDTTELARYPLLFALSTPRIERRSIEKIDGGLATGILTKASKLGVMVDSCPGTQRAWTGTTRPNGASPLSSQVGAAPRGGFLPDTSARAPSRAPIVVVSPART